MNTITVDELKALFKMSIELLEKSNKKKYELNFDSYWTITHKEWLNFSKAPEPGVGSLSEDIYYLKEGIADKDCFNFIDFDKISSVLKAISEIEAPAG